MLKQSAEYPTPTVLIIGVGDLGARVAHLLSLQAQELHIVLASRSLDRAVRHANLVKLAAFNLGLERKVDGIEIDLQDLSRTADVIAGLRPDIIFMGASLQAARIITNLPGDAFRTLDQAQLGPWLPVHLTLVGELMASVKLAGSPAKVINACYPDAVGPALKSVHLAPHLGIGNVGNVIPALTHGVARQLGVEVGETEILLVAHHYFSHHVHRFGEASRIPYALQATVAGQTKPLDHARLFASLAAGLRRQGGRDGQQLTATSATSVIRAALGMVDGTFHAPSPDGLTGGFPVRFERGNHTPRLPWDLTLTEAESINRDCQRLDGIADISPAGVVRFADEQMGVMKELLGYECTEMKVIDAREHAEELQSRYAMYLKANGYS